MAAFEKEKLNKATDVIRKDIVILIIIMLIIGVYVFYECYSATHVEVETITAVTTTVYESIEAKALIIRDEHIVDNSSGAVTVPCVADGGKVKVNGNIAMQFANEENAKNYALLQNLHNELDYYVELESRSAGVATDIETLNKEIIGDVNEYIRTARSGSVNKLSPYGNDLNDKLTRRQMIIGQNIDFTGVKTDLQNQINALSAVSSEPSGYLTTQESGIFSSYTDGMESILNYDEVKNLDAAALKGFIEQAENAKQGSQSFGKLITSYEWYFCAVVTADDVKDIKNGDSLDVAVKDSDEVIKCQVLSGADIPLGQEETVLILKSSQMGGEITSMRLEDIEIRYNSYSGFKVPSSAVHIDEEGNKCVYALVANQVSLREGEIVYSTKDYSIFSYNPDSSNSIRFYDQIITKGKDLHDGKVYT